MGQNLLQEALSKADGQDPIEADIADLRTAFLKNPQNNNIWEQLSFRLMRQQRYDDAVELGRKCMEFLDDKKQAADIYGMCIRAYASRLSKEKSMSFLGEELQTAKNRGLNTSLLRHIFFTGHVAKGERMDLGL